LSWRVAFLILAAINLLALGAVAGFALNGGFNTRPATIQQDVAAPAAMLRALPPGSRAQVRRALAAGWRDTQAERAAVRAAREETARLIAAEPYDAAAVRDALARQRQASERVTARLHEHVASAVGELTPEQRRQLLVALQRRVSAEDSALVAPEEGAVGSEQERLPATREDRRERFREKLRQRREQRGN
jgi:uncharacterized membrane protein